MKFVTMIIAVFHSIVKPAGRLTFNRLIRIVGRQNLKRDMRA